MLMQVTPETFAFNLMLILGAVILLTLIFTCMIVVWTAINALIWFRRKRRRVADFLRLHRRADGQRYPPFTSGVCQSCGRGDDRIYFAQGSDGLCSICYEETWPCTSLLNESPG
jgi:hypothetical protein